MTFLSPVMLWGLAAAPLLVAAYVLLQRRRRAYVVKFTNLKLLADVAPRRPGWRRHAAPLLLLMTFMMLVGALARPAVSVAVPKEQSSIVLVVDVSLSMSATDLSPDRMTAAKQAANDFVRSLPQQLRVAVVAFSDTAAVISPLTRDRAQTRNAIDSLQPVGGTAIGDGLAAALTQIQAQRGDKVPAAVLLLSDGASNRGRPSLDVAQEAHSLGVPVYTVGVGTESGVLQFQGRTVPVTLDEAELKGIAATTGASYFRTTDAEALRSVYRDLGSKLGYEKETREATAAAAGIALLLLLAGAGVSLFWFQRVP